LSFRSPKKDKNPKIRIISHLVVEWLSSTVAAGISHMEISLFFKELRHPHEGGDPGFSIKSALRTLDFRLRGDDGNPLEGILFPNAITLTVPDPPIDNR